MLVILLQLPQKLLYVQGNEKKNKNIVINK